MQLMKNKPPPSSFSTTGASPMSNHLVSMIIENHAKHMTGAVTYRLAKIFPAKKDVSFIAVIGIDMPYYDRLNDQIQIYVDVPTNTKNKAWVLHDDGAVIRAALAAGICDSDGDEMRGVDVLTELKHFLDTLDHDNGLRIGGTGAYPSGDRLQIAVGDDTLGLEINTMLQAIIYANAWIELTKARPQK